MKAQLRHSSVNVILLCVFIWSVVIMAMDVQQVHDAVRAEYSRALRLVRPEIERVGEEWFSHHPHFLYARGRLPTSSSDVHRKGLVLNGGILFDSFSTPELHRLMQEEQLDRDCIVEFGEHVFYTDRVPGKDGAFFQVFIDATQSYRDANLRIVLHSVILVCLGLLLCGTISLIMNRGLFRPLEEISAIIRRRIGDDLPPDKAVTELDMILGLISRFGTRYDRLGRQVVSGLDTLEYFLQELEQRSKRLTSESHTVKTQARQVSRETVEMSMEIEAIAATSDMMGNHMDQVTDAVTRLSSNMQSIVESTRDLDEAIGKIAAKAGEGSDTVEAAGKQSRSAVQTMGNLHEAAAEIGEVTALIRQLADQTDLLALNAAIEAANAGDVGSGFAVIAAEIKELSGRSAKASEEISARIEAIQEDVSLAMAEITRIDQVMEAIDLAVETINHLVHRHLAATAHIVSNVGEADREIRDIRKAITAITESFHELSLHSGHAAQGTGEIERGMRTVFKAVEAGTAASFAVNVKLGEIQRVADAMRHFVTDFERCSSLEAIRHLKQCHFDWKNEVDQALELARDNGEDGEEASVEMDDCGFTAWTEKARPEENEAKREIFGSIDAYHREFHHFAAELLELSRSGDTLRLRDRLIGLERCMTNLFLSVDDFFVAGEENTRVNRQDAETSTDTPPGQGRVS